MNCDKVKIKTSTTQIIINDPELKFSLIETDYDSDGDCESEPYTIKQLVNEAEKYRQEADLKVQSNFEKYKKDIQVLQDAYNKLKKENDTLTAKLKELILK